MRTAVPRTTAVPRNRSVHRWPCGPPVTCLPMTTSGAGTPVRMRPAAAAPHPAPPTRLDRRPPGPRSRALVPPARQLPPRPAQCGRRHGSVRSRMPSHGGTRDRSRTGPRSSRRPGHPPSRRAHAPQTPGGSHPPGPGPRRPTPGHPPHPERDPRPMPGSRPRNAPTIRRPMPHARRSVAATQPLRPGRPRTAPPTRHPRRRRAGPPCDP